MKITIKIFIIVAVLLVMLVTGCAKVPDDAGLAKNRGKVTASELFGGSGVSVWYYIKTNQGWDKNNSSFCIYVFDEGNVTRYVSNMTLGQIAQMSDVEVLESIQRSDDKEYSSPLQLNIATDSTGNDIEEEDILVDYQVSEDHITVGSFQVGLLPYNSGILDMYDSHFAGYSTAMDPFEEDWGLFVQRLDGDSCPEYLLDGFGVDGVSVDAFDDKGSSAALGGNFPRDEQAENMDDEVINDSEEYEEGNKSNQYDEGSIGVPKISTIDESVIGYWVLFRESKSIYMHMMDNGTYELVERFNDDPYGKVYKSHGTFAADSKTVVFDGAYVIDYQITVVNDAKIWRWDDGDIVEEYIEAPKEEYDTVEGLAN